MEDRVKNETVLPQMCSQPPCRKAMDQHAHQAFGAQRPVAESVEPQVELEVDEKGAPHQ